MTPLGWAIPNNLSNSGCLIISIWARLSAFQARHTCWTGYPEPSLPSSWSLVCCSFWPEQLLLLKRLHVAKTRALGKSALTSTLSDAEEKKLAKMLDLNRDPVESITLVTNNNEYLFIVFTSNGLWSLQQYVFMESCDLQARRKQVQPAC